LERGISRISIEKNELKQEFDKLSLEQKRIKEVVKHIQICISKREHYEGYSKNPNDRIYMMMNRKDVEAYQKAYEEIDIFLKQLPHLRHMVLGELKTKSGKNLFRKFNKEEKKQAETLLKEFDIFHLKNKLINEVSGGQLQRALIARALISSPELIFLDEPESFLDKEFEFKLFEKIKKLSDSTIVVISHELEKIYDYIDSIFVVEGNIRVFEKKEDYVCSNPYLHSHK